MSPLTEPAPDRAYGFNRDWGSGPIFAGRSDDISGVWRGSISLSGGRYLFTLFVRDGVRLYIDETLTGAVLSLHRRRPVS